MESLHAIEASQLVCERGGRRVFQGVSFAVLPGALLSLEGPNGAGKTSLLRMLAGFIAPVSGSLVFQGNGARVEDAEERGRFVAWLGHQDGVKAQMSVGENLAFFAALYGAGGSQDVLSRVGLGKMKDLPAQYLSAGQRRRLGLARLILSARPLWLLDEPLAALDAAGKNLAAELMREHCARGGIVIAATHDALGVAGQALTMGRV